MGCISSVLPQHNARKNLASVLPSVDWSEVYYDEAILKVHGMELAKRYRTAGWGVFLRPRDRENFVVILTYSRPQNEDTVLLVMGDNGEHDFVGLAFALLYPLANQSSSIRYHASLVAVRDSTVIYSLTSKNTGTTKQEAFKHLKAEAEKRLGMMLLQDEHADALTKRTRKAAATLPPAYPGTVVVGNKAAS